jgi:hypothetical protein
MDILNFISWIKGKRQVNSVDPARTLLPVALKDGRRDDDYLTGAITVQDFTTQVASVIPSGAQGPAGPQGVPGPVGPAGLNWQGTWSAASVYAVDDAVGYAGASWFCIDPVGPSVTPPNADPTNWALLASQGAIGPQGPQGIQGPAGPSGSGVPGTLNGQTTYWNSSTSQWTPNSGLRANGSATSASRVAIGGANFGFYSLDVLTNGGGINIGQTNIGFGIGNNFQTNTATLQWGLNPPVPGNPIMDNSFYFTQNLDHAIKFATGFSVSGGDRLIIQGDGQVTVGPTFAANVDAAFIVNRTGFEGIEIEQPGKGIIVASPDGTRYKIHVANGGSLQVTPV